MLNTGLKTITMFKPGPASEVSDYRFSVCVRVYARTCAPSPTADASLTHTLRRSKHDVAAPFTSMQDIPASFKVIQMKRLICSRFPFAFGRLSPRQFSAGPSPPDWDTPGSLWQRCDTVCNAVVPMLNILSSEFLCFFLLFPLSDLDCFSRRRLPDPQRHQAAVIALVRK